MAKKNNILPTPPFGLHIPEDDDDIDFNDIGQLKLMFMTTLAEMGVTAEEYAAFLADNKAIAKQRERLMAMADEYPKAQAPALMHAEGIPDADEKSLRLKVQLNGVNKPPMWREIVVPADFNFGQLHRAIQVVTGLTDSHLWQFQHHAYEQGLAISIPADSDLGMGVDECTHDAYETPVTAFLAEKGDKLEYVYDFGDDWIFTVSVLEVLDREGEVALCTKWKCDFQPIEDCGGVYAYLQIRDLLTSDKKLTAKQKKQAANNLGFDTFRQLEAWVDNSMMDIEFVNEQLADI